MVGVWCRGLALNFASTHQTENPRGFSEVGENQQLLIAIVGHSVFYFGVTFQVVVSKVKSENNSLELIILTSPCLVSLLKLYTR